MGFFILFFDGDSIYYSPLFSNEVVKKDTIIERNPYLEDDNYNRLKRKIKNATVTHYVGDIQQVI